MSDCDRRVQGLQELQERQAQVRVTMKEADTAQVLVMNN